jgi:NCS1 family nucleobase:cation symporter-1
MIVSVPLTLPGLVNSINPNIRVGVGKRLFDIAYMLGVSAIFRTHEIPLNLTHKFTLASTVYLTLSKLFPANDTMLDHAILGDGTLSDDRSFSNSDSKKDDAQVDESKVA